jgi:ABC-2 type transport system ATP-binding protein
VLGESIEHPERFAARVGALIENPALVGSLSGRDNLRSLAALRGLPASRIDAVIETVGLTGRDGDRASTYSLGMKQRLGIAAALLPDPELLVLDEPTNGLDPAGIVEIRTLLKTFAADGRTVVVSSHLLSEIQAMADELVIIRFGELVYAGSLEELMSRAVERVIAAPESPSDMPRLITLVEARGWSCDLAGDELVVGMPIDQAADLNRAANDAGLVLRVLTPQQDTLETIFLNLTGSTDAELFRTSQRATPREWRVMRNVVRSELIRLWRPSFLYGGIGVMAGFAALVSVFIYTAAPTAAGAAPPRPGVGGSFATVAQIAQPGGFLTALATVSTLAGTILLALWTICAASVYSTGVIRILVQAQPKRIKLLAGKMVALLVFTLLATVVTTLIVVLAAHPLARLEGIETRAWKTDFFPHLLSAYANFAIAAVVWGLIGLALAVLTRSSALAIGVGVGYLLVVENLIGIIAPGATPFLPGGALNALVSGGTSKLTWLPALGAHRALRRGRCQHLARRLPPTRHRLLTPNPLQAR